MDEYGWIDR
ncbi:hypothetical protein CGLO_17477 [Colletotrichum gloeosporioides Cg-14]|uniref:Uncharacterized protein n=1 Tax=Colletotrichum gloeosporioides (strain Cg-14) TaxID=1237896 RepID=T0KWS8_COLGC|nr:hypothetical protein CGLO_17477 [Colletotrichum gloeosporioides Cg-14]